MSREHRGPYTESDIAIIGMSGRLPGAQSIDDYWRNLRNGVESIRFFTLQELEAAGVAREKLAQPNFVPAWGDVEGTDLFDAEFFGINPMDAAVMDPQHRVFLEVAWEALEDAGYDPSRIDGPVGVFGGSGMHAYMMYNLLTNPDLIRARGEFAIRTNGNDMDFLATRVSYLLNLRGPAVGIQTACSTSLVAVHFACQSLLNGECDYALAGGVTLALPQHRGYVYRDGDILSHDGHCRAFDASATGTVFGSGAGVVVLKPLLAALEDGDPVRAIIRGSAINNDGSAKVGYTAPSVSGQAAVIAEALAVANVDADTISYIEAHGTGTAVGDPIEIAALTRAFRSQTDRRAFCGVGSVKTNIGHVDTASGVAGLMKVVLSLQNRELPPSLHFEKANPEIDFENSPFYVNDQLRPWGTNGAPRRAGVSSLGVGGTNAHVIVEEAPAIQNMPGARSWKLLVQSARSRDSLEQASARLAAYLERHADEPIDDVAYTLQVGRRAFDHRRFVVCQDATQAHSALSGADPARLFTQKVSGDKAEVVFMFPGGGAQYVGMAAGLYRELAAFRESVDRCIAILESRYGIDIRRFLAADTSADDLAPELERPANALAALFTIEYALAQLWRSWGITPTAMIGHSMGEYVAACLAGVFSLEDALGVVVKRGRLFETLPEGGMLSVPLPEADVRAQMPEGLSIAAVNAPSLCVVSGRTELIDAMEKQLSEREIPAGRIHISVAAHSALVEPILEEFEAFMRSIELHAPTLPFVSNVTGDWITEGEARDPTYWVRHLRQTVLFSQGVSLLLQERGRVLLEVGPGRTLGTLARQRSGDPAPPAAVLSSLRHPRDDQADMAFLLTTLGQMWLTGVEVDWNGFHAGEVRRRVHLPTYPFARKRFWISPGQASSGGGQAATTSTQAGATGWLTLPSWRPTPPVAATRDATAGATLLLSDGSEFAKRLADRLGSDTIVVTRGGKFGRRSVHHYELDPGSVQHYHALMSELAAEGRLPRRIVHLWNLVSVPGADSAHLPNVIDFDTAFHSFVFLAQALSDQPRTQPVRIVAFTNRMQQLAGERTLHPGAALVLGPCGVIPRELPDVACSSIDVDLPADPDGWEARRLLDRIIGEIEASTGDPEVAYRGGQRWVRTYEPVHLSLREDAGFRRNGTYLITGGLGDLGLALAERLTSSLGAHVVLIGRTPLPSESEWDEWLADTTRDSAVRSRIAALRAMHRSGASVTVVTADVSDLRRMREVVRDVVRRCGTIDGAIHAAGVLSDGAVQLKSREDAESVLIPKVQGTLALATALDEIWTETSSAGFIALYSSVTPLVGIAGQVDHAAANAFLDAFATWRTANTGRPTVSINWGPWRDIGQAARTGVTGTRSSATSHPLIDECIESDDRRSVYARTFSGAEWLLADHRIKAGHPLLAGVTYLELVHAAMRQRYPESACELRNVFFVTPFAVEPDRHRELRAVFSHDVDGSRFVIESRLTSNAKCEHVRGEVRGIKAAASSTDIGEVAARCNVADVRDPEIEQAVHVHFGPRWQNIRRVRAGAREALVDIELDAAYQDEVSEFCMHPAMLDMATGGAHRLIPGHDGRKDFYVPFSYGTVRVLAPFTRHIVSHIRYRADQQGPTDTAVFDVTIMDESGRHLVEIADYVVRRVPDPASVTAGDPPVYVEGGSETGRGLRAGTTSETGSADSVAIPPSTGLDVLATIVSNPEVSRIVVSPRPIEALIASANRPPMTEDDGVAPDADPIREDSGVRFARPDLATPYVAPANDVEERIAAIWQRALGIEGIGVHDDFLELGGHSLMVVTIHSDIQKELGVTFPVSKTFQHSTINSMARFVLELKAETNEPDRLSERAERQKAALARQRAVKRS